MVVQLRGLGDDSSTDLWGNLYGPDGLFGGGDTTPAVTPTPAPTTLASLTPYLLGAAAVMLLFSGITGARRASRSVRRYSKQRKSTKARKYALKAQLASL
jgi:hypothetical protein